MKEQELNSTEKQELNEEEKGFKLLISGTTNSGKTTLLKTLKDAVVFSYDSKPFPFTNVLSRDIFTEKYGGMLESGDDFANRTMNLLKAYKKIKNKYPDIIAIDSISTVVGDLETRCGEVFGGFEIYKNYRNYIKRIDHAINNITDKLGINVVMITHAQYNDKIDKWEDTTKGSFAKKDGGFLSVVDYAINIDVNKDGTRTVYLKNPYRLSRTMVDLNENELEVDADSFNLQNYVDKIKETIKNANKYKI